MHRVTSYSGGYVDVVSLSCLATNCKKAKSKFSSRKYLAYHVSVSHKPVIPGIDCFICLLCGSLFTRDVGLQVIRLLIYFYNRAGFGVFRVLGL